MTVKELLAVYDDQEGIVSIQNEYDNLIFRDTLGLVVANKEYLQREVVRFDFIDDELCIHIKETVYDAVQNMDKEAFTRFCLKLYRMGLKDGEDNVSDECFMAVYFADCSMKQCTDWFSGELKWEYEKNE